MNLLIAAILILIISIVMSMLGKGGGNFYVIIFYLLGNFSIHQSAANSQFILFITAFTSLIIYHKNKRIIWKLALLIGICSSIASFLGAYTSYMYEETIIRSIIIILLIVSGLIMIIPIKIKQKGYNKKIYWTLNIDNNIYSINIVAIIIFSLIIGFFSGITGMAGGTFFVPLMLLICGLNIHLAISTASVLIVSTSFMGFMGHFIKGEFNNEWIIELTLLAILGGFIGSHFSLKSKSKILKWIFALTNWIVALLFIIIHLF